MHNHKSVMIVSPPGSGKSVIIAEIARLATNKGNRILFFVHRKELVKQIKDSFKQNDVDLNRCIISTVGKIANHLKEIPKPQLIIIDEAHHTRAGQYMKIINYFSNIPRLGFTATPWRMSGKGFTDIYDVMVEGMQVQELIDNKKLAPYLYISRKLGDYRKLQSYSNQDYTSQSMAKFIKTINFGDMLKTYHQHAEGLKTIVYTPSIKAAKLVAGKFIADGIQAVEVDSKTPIKVRTKIMNRFRTGEIKVLVNVDLVSEGFNVPDCQCVIMLRPTKSLVLYLQQAMRCMRYQEGKKAVIIDHVGNFEQKEVIGSGKSKRKAPFGFPRDYRVWTLEDRKKATRKSEDDLKIAICKNCFAVFPASYSECPNCGTKIGKTKKNAKALNLEDKTEMDIVDNSEKPILFTTNYVILVNPNEAKSMEELYQYAKAKGYKPGWAYYKGKALGLIR